MNRRAEESGFTNEQMPNLLVLSNKRFSTDFRKYLMRAAERSGSAAVHVYCWHEIIISARGGEHKIFRPDVSPAIVAETLTEYLPKQERTLVLTGLGCHDHVVAATIQRTLPGTYIYDVYDDLMFNAKGLDLVQRQLQDIIWRARCEHTLVLNAALTGRYPGAVHLDNASHLGPVMPLPTAYSNRMVYVGSIDTRVDFEWMRILASYKVNIDIFGRVHADNRVVSDQLANLVRQSPYVNYHGEYDNDDLWNILPGYSVGLLPYLTNDPMTEYINPDKLYHYLNAGLEVLAAPIPPVQLHSAFIHLASREGDWERTLKNVESSRRADAWCPESFSWDARWRQFVHAFNKNDA